MQALLATLLLAAAPSPKTLLTSGPIKLLEVSSERNVPLLPKGAEVVVLVEGAALVPIAPGNAPLKAGDTVFAPAPGPWTLQPRPRVRAIILALPAPKNVLATTVRSEKDAVKFRMLSGKGEGAIILDKDVVGTDAFSQQRLTLQPGAAVPAHQHPGSAELIYVVSGQTEVTLDGKPQVLKAGEAVIIPAGAQHAAKVVGQEPFQAIQFYVPGGPEQRFKGPGAAAPPGAGGGGAAGAPDAGVTSAATPR
ncbi:MAG TPA: cupin domain-containing protein [Myxococcales bacterium]|jgi:quercetin dioxygenase-like cupin family protein|nr:cupin domain-containing protein [Myxococcales bacterium]